MVLLEKFEDRGRALDGEFALALALPKDHAPAAPLGALVSMSHAIRRTGTLVANVSLPYAAWFTSCAVSMLPAALLAGRAVPLFAARMWIIAAMPPGEALNLKPCSDHTGFQVHIRPAETKGFSLPYAKRKSYRPSSAVSLVSGDIQDAASLLTRQGLDLVRSHRGSVYQGGHVS